MYIYIYIGGIATPLKNMSSSVGMMTFPIYGNIKHVSNHQPDIVFECFWSAHTLWIIQAISSPCAALWYETVWIHHGTISGSLSWKKNPKRYISLGPPSYKLVYNPHENYSYLRILNHNYLVGGFNPSEKYESQIGSIIPNIWKIKTCSKPPTSYSYSML